MGFYSALMAMGKKKPTEHHHDQEAAGGGSHDQHKQESHPPNNFLPSIFGKKTEHHEEAGGSHDHQQKQQESHPPKNDLFSRVFGKKTEHHEQVAHHEQHNHQLHPPNHFFSRVLHRVELFLRIFTLIFLVAGVIVLVVNQVSTLTFLDLAAFRYIFAAIIIAQTYIIVQIIFSFCRLVTGIQRGFIALYFDFLGDKILSYLLATGAAAAFGASIDTLGGNSAFYARGKAAASLVLIAFFFSAISSIISSHSLPKHHWFL